MSIALISLLLLIVIILISCFVLNVNPGLLAILAALLIGQYGGIPIKAIVSYFPGDLFILLVSICIVFSFAEKNGTLATIANYLVSLIKGNVLLLPIIFFVLSFSISALGPGNIAAVALLAALCMTLSVKYKLSPLVTAIMLCTGANAGALSPLSPTGIIASGLMTKIGLESKSLSWQVFMASALLQSLTAVVAYIFFLYRSVKRKKHLTVEIIAENTKHKDLKLNSRKAWTLCIIFLMILSIIVFKLPLVLSALFAGLLLSLFALDDPEAIYKSLPWSTILMVTGISVLIGMMEKTGGLDLATTLIARVTNPKYINGVLAFITGLISAYSSSSGVVMPTFIPMLPSLADKIGFINQIEMVIAVAVGSHMVDVSPLSTLGALCVAAITIESERKRVFKLLLMWGMSMAVVGGLVAYLFLDLTNFYV